MLNELNQEKNMQLPAVALRGLTIMPGTMIHFDLSRDKSVRSIEHAMAETQQIFLVTQRDSRTDDPSIDTVYHCGTISQIKQVIKLPNNIVRVLVEGQRRGSLISFIPDMDYLLAVIKEAETENDVEQLQEEAMIREISTLFSEYASYFPKVGKAFARQFEEIKQCGSLLDAVAANMPLAFTKKQQILEQFSIVKRYEITVTILKQEIEIAKIRMDLQNDVKSRVEKNQKEYILREQLSYIRKELGEDNTETDSERFLAETQKLLATDEIKEKITKEIRRFQGMASNSSENSVMRGYIETLLEMPWDYHIEENKDIQNAKKILDRDHYGMDKVKERMLEFLAVRNLTSKGESPIICLVGPPGTGKTSIAKSIAEALNKPYVRICLGGVRDEAEIRGHRRTYVGAMPGRIASGIKNAGVKNPLMLLDEIDKVSSDYKGDTSAALLEVLDSEQNNRFRDHYIEIPIDLSEVLFIATANSVADIPRPLLDRMELVEVSSYTENEKLHIAKEHLVKKQLDKNGLKPSQMKISDGALQRMIHGYTREAGVRNLEREIGRLCRKSARQIFEGEKKSIRITEKNLEDYLGKEKYSYDMAGKTDEIGIVRGLAWTAVGGDTLEIEVNVMPGKGEISLTGQLGDVMKESAMAGLSYIRSQSKHFGISESFYKKNDFHIHIPEGATPKDGPSAGITMATAMLSAITRVPVRRDIAMTGEITLRGRVLPIGGLKEKILAAKNAGIKVVLVPKQNEKDILEISYEIKEGLEIEYVESMEQVIKKALCKPVGKDEDK